MTFYSDYSDYGFYHDDRDIVYSSWHTDLEQPLHLVIRALPFTLLAIAILRTFLWNKECSVRLWESLAAGKLARLWGPTADFTRLRHSVQAAYPPLLSEHLTMDKLCNDIESFQRMLRSLREPMEKSAPLSEKSTALRLFRDIMANTKKLRKALGDYRAEIDIGSYRCVISKMVFES
jgi:hypothetical protein